MNSPKTQKPTRKLSLFRIFLALVITLALIYYSYTRVQTWEDNQITSEAAPWFAPYVDATATPLFDFAKLGSRPNTNLVLSFIVASASDPCKPTWGNAYDLDQAGIELDLDRRIARLRQLGGNISVSFGGLINNELAENCTDPTLLKNAYKSVIDRYAVQTLDFDIEGEALRNSEALKRRAQTLAMLQKEMRTAGNDLAIWLTVPVAPSGLTKEGTDAVAIMLSNGVDLAGLNVMTMDYGQSKSSDQSMFEASKSALIQTHRQLGILYDQAGTHLNSASLWRKIGATPMIGQNDISGEIFTLDDAVALNKFVIDNGIYRVSMWSANRDIQCGENYVNITIVSDSCSGVEQKSFAYMDALGKNLNGLMQQSESLITTEDPLTTPVQDDPSTSPYQIWDENNVYLADTKVVWHGNVYQAKWWTQGDLPDNPTLQSWETPWELIGPVLPGESYINQLTLPEGTFPEWSGKAQYDVGDIVLYNSIAYKAKWWTQGDSPAALSSNPTSSPWIALTQKQIEQLLNDPTLNTTSLPSPTVTTSNNR